MIISKHAQDGPLLREESQTDVGIGGARRCLTLISALPAKSRNVSGCRQLASRLQTQRSLPGMGVTEGSSHPSSFLQGGCSLPPTSSKGQPSQGESWLSPSVPVLSLRPFFLCGMVSSLRPLSEICLPSIDSHPSLPAPQGAFPPLL